MNNFKLLATDINVTPLLMALDEQPELWKEITVRQNFEGSAHADTESIILRGPVNLEALMEDVNTADYPAAERLAPKFTATMMNLAGMIGIRELGRVMLAKLKAGGSIKEHADEGGYARYFSRFHLVLKSSPMCLFHCGAETVSMLPGELWWFNHRAPHRVENLGPERIHLIVDAIAPGFSGALVPQNVN